MKYTSSELNLSYNNLTIIPTWCNKLRYITPSHI